MGPHSQLPKALYFTHPCHERRLSGGSATPSGTCPCCPRLGASRVTDFIHCPTWEGSPSLPGCWVWPDDCCSMQDVGSSAEGPALS